MVVLGGVAAGVLVAGLAAPASQRSRLDGVSVEQSLEGPTSIVNGLRGNQRMRSNVPAKTNSVDLASGDLRDAVERLRRGKPAPRGIEVSGSRVRVEIGFSLRMPELRRLIIGLGAIRVQPAGGRVVEALVPFDRLAAVERLPGVRFVRPPIRVDLPIGNAGAGPNDWLPNEIRPAALYVGEELTKTNANTWHAAGRIGAGVRVGIIDTFDGGIWNAAAQNGEIPSGPAGTICPGGCNIWGGGDHGVAVAEIVHEMAPGAALYLATARGAANLQAAVDYFVNQGVRIITRSETAEYDGPGNGTGGIAAVIENAVSRGVTWFNSAGNSAGPWGQFNLGQYWRGSWKDTNANGYLEFQNSGAVDEGLAFVCSFVNGFRWSDWGNNRTDYDVFVYDDANLTVIDTSSTNDQLTGGFPPIELLNNGLKCTGDGDVDYLVVKLDREGGGTAGDVLEFMGNLSAFEYWQNPYSASGPASDTASVGALAVGAVDPPLGGTIAAYSSWGPTNDGRMKPDLSAASCVANFTYRDTSRHCFSGTSASTPVAAGAGALVLGATSGATPAAVKAALMASVVDRGAAGPDNVYGIGELVLPAIAAPSPPPPTPPAPPPAPTVRTVAMSMGGPRASFQRERTFQVSWRAVANAARYDVQYRAAQFRGIYGSWKAWKTATPETSTSFIGQTGTSYCFRVKANPQSGFASNFTNPRCTTVPVSVLNRTMRGRGGWRYYRASGRYLNRFALSVRRGATLGLTGVRATRLALVATKCPRCGSVSVYWNKRRIASVRLTSSSLLYKQIIEVGSFTSQQKGSIRIVVTSRGKPVAIEGLGVFS